MKARALTAVIAATVLMACQQGPSEEQMMMQNAEQLSGEQIRKTLVGNTTYETGQYDRGNFKFAAYYMKGGEARGRAWWSSGQQLGNGRWRIDGDLFCLKWNPHRWGKGEESCHEVFKEGDHLNLIVVSGPTDSDKVVLKKGNPYDL